jgi:hypothetical protein
MERAEGRMKAALEQQAALHQDENRVREREHREQLGALRDSNSILRADAESRLVTTLTPETSPSISMPAPDSSTEEEPGDPEWEERQERRTQGRSREDNAQRGRSAFFLTEQRRGQSLRNFMGDLTQLCIEGWGRGCDQEAVKLQFLKGMSDTRIADMLKEHISEDILEDMNNEEILGAAAVAKDSLKRQASCALHTRAEVERRGKKALEKNRLEQGGGKAETSGEHWLGHHPVDSV